MKQIKTKQMQTRVTNMVYNKMAAIASTYGDMYAVKKEKGGSHNYVVIYPVKCSYIISGHLNSFAEYVNQLRAETLGDVFFCIEIRKNEEGVSVPVIEIHISISNI